MTLCNTLRINLLCMLVSGTVFVIDYHLSVLAYEQNLSPDGSLQMQFEGKKSLISHL